MMVGALVEGACLVLPHACLVLHKKSPTQTRDPRSDLLALCTTQSVAAGLLAELGLPGFVTGLTQTAIVTRRVPK